MNPSRILLSLLALASWVITSAQSPYTFYSNPNFGYGYPMVTSLRNWYIYPIDLQNGEEQIPVGLFDFITKVNGKDVLTENGLDEFNKSDVVTVEYFDWPDQEGGTFTFFNGLYNERNDVGDMMSLHPYDLVPLYRYAMPGMTIVKSDNTDFTDLRTYDFLIEGNDPLVDEELLNEFMKGVLTKRMKRDTENPDVIFRIAKNTDESFSTTYVPPTQEIVGTTTTLNPVYNYITRTTSYQAKQRLNTIQKAGHTEVTNVANVFLEVVALDAKKLNDPNQTTPPEIWKMTYSANEVNDNRTAMQRYKDILGACVYPFKAPCAYMVGTPLMTGAKLVPSADKKSLTVTEVAHDSPASDLGLLPGDIILKVNGKNEFKRIVMSKNGYSLQEQKIPLGELSVNMAQDANFIFVIKMDPSKETGYKLKGIEYKGLNKDKDNEFLVERDGKKIKLKGQLWLEQLYDMDADTLRNWCINNNSMPYVCFPY